jgi:flagellar basal body-associated protein FliL
MKLTMIMILAALFAFTTAGMASAAGTIKKNTSTTVRASVKNTTTTSTKAAVMLKGYDQAGTRVANLCKKDVYLPKGASTVVSYTWRAPNYATGLYWNSKVNTKNYCE